MTNSDSVVVKVLNGIKDRLRKWRYGLLFSWIICWIVFIICACILFDAKSVIGFSVFLFPYLVCLFVLPISLFNIWFEQGILYERHRNSIDDNCTNEKSSLDAQIGKRRTLFMISWIMQWIILITLACIVFDASIVIGLCIFFFPLVICLFLVPIHQFNIELQENVRKRNNGTSHVDFDIDDFDLG